MAAAARTVLGAAGVTAEIHERSDSAAAQPGAAFALFADFIGGTRHGADRAGAPHRPAGRIGARVARQLLAEVDSGATVDRHAGDQIIPFASLADGTSSFQIPFITEHTETAGWLAWLFLRTEVRAAGNTLVVHGRDACSRRMYSRGEHDPPTGRSPASARGYICLAGPAEPFQGPVCSADAPVRGRVMFGPPVRDLRPLASLVRAGHIHAVCEAREGARPHELARETAVGGKAEKPDSYEAGWRPLGPDPGNAGEGRSPRRPLS